MMSFFSFSTAPFSALADSFVNAGAALESVSLVDADSKIKYQMGALLDAVSQTDMVPHVKFYEISTPFNVDSSVVGDNKILLLANTAFDIQTQFSVEYLSRSIGLSDLIGNSSFDIDSYIKILDSTSLNVDVSLGALFAAKYANEVTMSVVGILSTNLSQRNRDIVYYVLAIDRETPLQLNIMRVK